MDQQLPPRRAAYADIPFIHVLRAIAVCLVLYDHLVGSYLSEWKKLDWGPKRWIDTFIAAPFGIIQSFGFMGVSLFFLVSGYIITHVASSEARGEFLIKRILRIYPPLIVSILICVLFGKWIALPDYSVTEILLSFSLLNYLSLPQIVILGVAWSLVVEVEFYLVTLLLLATLKRAPGWHVLLQSILVGACIAACREFGPRFFLFAASFSYLPFLLVGQLMYYRQRDKISRVPFLALVVLQLAMLQWGIRTIHTQFLPVDNSYLINFSYSLALFYLLSRSGLQKTEGLTKHIAETSYSLYLLHGSIGVGLLNMLTLHLGYTPSLLITAAALGIAALISFRFIEKPSQRFARKLITAWRGN